MIQTVRRVTVYPCDDFLDPLFVTLHIQECLDLTECQVFSITQCDKLVEGADEFKRIAQDLTLVQTPANARDHLRKQMERVDVLQDV